jgi:hypothetical protein
VTLLPPKSERQMHVSEQEEEKLSRGDCFFFEDANVSCDLRIGADEAERRGLVPPHQHPVLKDCAMQYSPLFPGDVVFFPAYWYHYFHNVESAMSVTVQTKHYCAKASSK